MTDYLTCAATAKIIRKALKEAFPGIKFSVRSHTYAGGASIRIEWTDGPTDKQVNEITQTFAGGWFDGMTDYKGGKVHTFNGQPVHFGADFIFTNRQISDTYRAKMAETWETLGSQQQCDLLNGVMLGHRGRDDDRAACLARTLPVFQPQPSPTAASVELIHTY